MASTGWRVAGVELVETWADRWRGQMRLPPRALLMPTRSVHGFWLRHPIWVVSLDEGGTVLSVDVLRRRRVVWIRSARWVLELPIEIEPPPTGSVLTWGHRLGKPGFHDRSPRSLLHPHREPG